MQEVQKTVGAEGELVLALSGEIDFAKAEEFYAAVSAYYAENPAPLRFDCEQLQFIDSTTLGTFVKILKMVKSDGYSLTLSGLQPKIKKLFVICALDKIMNVA